MNAQKYNVKCIWYVLIGDIKEILEEDEGYFFYLCSRQQYANILKIWRVNVLGAYFYLWMV